MKLWYNLYRTRSPVPNLLVMSILPLVDNLGKSFAPDESLGVRLGSVPDPNRPPVTHEGRCEADLGPEAQPGPILVSLVEWSVTANLRFAPDE